MLNKFLYTEWQEINWTPNILRVFKLLTIILFKKIDKNNSNELFEVPTIRFNTGFELCREVIDNISVEALVDIIDNFSERLKARVEANGGHFE